MGIDLTGDENQEVLVRSVCAVLTEKPLVTPFAGRTIWQFADGIHPSLPRSTLRLLEIPGGHVCPVDADTVRMIWELLCHLLKRVTGLLLPTIAEHIRESNPLTLPCADLARRVTGGKVR